MDYKFEDIIHQLRQDDDDVPIRETRVLWDRKNPMVHYNDEDFHRNFHFSKSNLLKIDDLICDDIQLQSMKGLPLNPIQQVCLTTSFFANGSFQHVAGYLAGVK